MGPQSAILPTRMSSVDNDGARLQWWACILAILLAPWLPLWAFFAKGNVFALAFFAAYGVILLCSLLLAHAKSAPTGWNSSWSGRAVLSGIVYSILGATISAAIAFAGCAMAVFSRF